MVHVGRLSMKKYLFLLGLIAMSFQLNSSAIFIPYSQKIPGTSLSFDMTPIPAGTFWMGSDEGSASDQKPRHSVRVDAFWMGTHEVTWDAFELFLDKQYEQTITEGGVPARVDALSRPSLPYLDMTFGMGKEGKPAVGCRDSVVTSQVSGNSKASRPYVLGDWIPLFLLWNDDRLWLRE